MTPLQKAQDLVNQFKNILMDEDTDCGNEMLCTSIAIKNAMIVMNEVIKATSNNSKQDYYWINVRHELEKM